MISFLEEMESQTGTSLLKDPSWAWLGGNSSPHLSDSRICTLFHEAKIWGFLLLFIKMYYYFLNQESNPGLFKT